jgi:hypothetical protein
VEEVITTTQGLPSNWVLALLPAGDGALWVGTEAGLAWLASGQVEEVITTTQGLPSNWVLALLPAGDGALWVGTEGGLARLAGGRVEEVITTAQGLPDDWVRALLPARDGALWVGTGGGLARLKVATTPPRIVKLIGQLGSKGAQITQMQHTFAAVPFDPKYETEGREWRFLWRLEQPSGETSETLTRSSYYEAAFEGDGQYKVAVQAIDKHGLKSEPYVYRFDVALPTEDPLEIWVTRIGGWGAVLAAVYFVGLFPLLFLYPHAGWARSAVNSGVFTKFPILHKIILNSDWARRRIFRRHAEMSIGAAQVPEHYIPQAIFRAVGTASKPLALDGASGSLTALFEPSRRVLVLARSGTGKSVLLRFLLREMGGRFLRGEDRRLPVLIDLRTCPIAGRDVEAVIRDALRGGGERPVEGGGVELPDAILDHLIRKGGFILLIDSLNELADWKDAAAFHPFFNRDAANYAIVASQVDLLERPDFATYRLAEVTPEQAGAYLHEVTGADVWEQLPAEARALARNPQDLVLLAEVIQALGPDKPVPSRRAELYREILSNDALADWAASGGAAIRAVYGLAMRMVEERLVVGQEQLREWLRAELESQDAFSEEAMAEIVGAIGRSRLFREETEVNVLGKRRPVTGFRHELVGKFLASRHVREVLGTPGDERRHAYLALSGEEAWLDLFYFIVDELDSKLALNAFLKELLDRAQPPQALGDTSGTPISDTAGRAIFTDNGDACFRIVAYALGTKPEDMILGEVRQSYSLAKLGEDLRRTPAA